MGAGGNRYGASLSSFEQISNWDDAIDGNISI